MVVLGENAPCHKSISWLSNLRKLVQARLQVTNTNEHVLLITMEHTLWQPIKIDNAHMFCDRDSLDERYDSHLKLGAMEGKTKNDWNCKTY